MSRINYQSLITETEVRHNSLYIKYKKENGADGECPWWCIYSFVELPSDIIDENGLPKIGAYIQLSYDELTGKTFPGPKYKRRPTPLNSKTLVRKMNKESLFEGVQLFSPITIDELLKRASETCTREQLWEIMQLQQSGNETMLRQRLLDILGISDRMLPKQEGFQIEYKSSFLHCPMRAANERMTQYNNIFSEICAFGNSHVDGIIYIGVKNDGTVSGVEEELENEAPFQNRNDFEADFINLMHVAFNNFQFVNSLKTTWYKTIDGKLFFKIEIPAWNQGVVFLNGNQLYVRHESSRRLLKDQDLINYIRNINNMTNDRKEV